jgi:hypothetical protein
LCPYHKSSSSPATPHPHLAPPPPTPTPLCARESEEQIQNFTWGEFIRFKNACKGSLRFLAFDLVFSHFQSFEKSCAAGFRPSQHRYRLSLGIVHRRHNIQLWTAHLWGRRCDGSAEGLALWKRIIVLQSSVSLLPFHAGITALLQLIKVGLVCVRCLREEFALSCFKIYRRVSHLPGLEIPDSKWW